MSHVADGDGVGVVLQYYGCLGYADMLIGQALTMLDDTGVSQNTVVSFIGGGSPPTLLCDPPGL